MTAGLKHNILAMKATKQLPSFEQVLVTLEDALAEIEQLQTKIKVIEEAALAAYRYHMLGYKEPEEFNANVMLDLMNELGEVL